jgi:hypothetical protein
MDTEEVKRIPIQDFDRCVRNNANECKWILVDVENYDVIKRFYERQCGGS